MTAAERRRVLKMLAAVSLIVDSDGQRQRKRASSPAQVAARERGQRALRDKRLAADEAKLQAQLDAIRKERGQ